MPDPAAPAALPPRETLTPRAPEPVPPTLAVAQASAPVTFTVYFAKGSDTVDDEAVATLRRVMVEVRARGRADIEIAGHADRRGSAAANDALSRRRAQRVQALLVAAGVEASRVRAAGHGERQPLVATGDEVAEPRNRRVDITIR